MDLRELKAQLMLRYNHKIELHAHTTPASRCSEITPKKLIETYKNLGFDGICVTNHFMISENLSKEEYIKKYLNDFIETKKYGDKAEIKVYLGAEIRFSENKNEYLIYGVNEKMLFEIYDFLNFGVENFRKNYSMPNSVFIQAHPNRDGIKEIPSHLLDGVEVFNMHPGHNSRVGLASLYAKENKLPIITAGSDFHHPDKNHEGLGAIRTTYLPEDSFELGKLLENRDYIIEVGRGNIIL
ncbi:MAG: PHP domain-containing protein [Clostridia bacterium]|nr:PHP domain-containing protein [Clostridia bacterium]